VDKSNDYTMSLRGRYIIDRIKSVISNHFRLPCPPYGDPRYWDAAYMSFGPQDSFEWGDVTLDDVLDYKYRPIEWDVRSSTSTTATTAPQHSSLGDALGIHPNADQDEPILMVGCGNSKIGEDMIDWGWRGPIIQVDVSSRVIETMSHRCHELIKTGHMNFVQDDACELSAFRDGRVQACLDKGLIDAFFCAEEYDQMRGILRSMSRVLKPGGSFVFLSFSRPEFLLPALMKDEMQDIRRRQWSNLQVHELEKILLYKIQKVNFNVHDPLRYRHARRGNERSAS
jgi:ubiquinone/menaquinone biosynthesis C-methylase UbiE